MLIFVSEVVAYLVPSAERSGKLAGVCRKNVKQGRPSFRMWAIGHAIGRAIWETSGCLNVQMNSVKLGSSTSRPFVDTTASFSIGALAEDSL